MMTVAITAHSEGVYADRELWAVRTVRVWTDGFEGVTITLQANRETLFTCPVVDQAALHGLLSVSRSNPSQAAASDVKQ